MWYLYEQNGKLYHRFEGITQTRKQKTLCFDHFRLQIKIPTASSDKIIDGQMQVIVRPAADK